MLAVNHELASTVSVFLMGSTLGDPERNGIVE